MTSGSDYQVYLDKFVSFPHLPVDSGCKEPPSRRRYHVLPPNIAHTGISSKFNAPTERPVLPTGTLTDQYLDNAFWRGRQTARAVMKNELAKIRPANEKSVKMESKLVEIEERRQKYTSLCEKQLENEIEFMDTTRQTKKTKKKQNRTTKPLTPLKKTRQRKIYNHSLTNFENLESKNRLSPEKDFEDAMSMSQSSLNRTRLINTEKWDQEALRLAYPEVEDDGDSISLAIEGLSKHSSERRGGGSSK